MDQREIQVGIPSMGIYGRFLRRSMGKALKDIGVTNIKLNLAPPVTRRTINRGAQFMDENMCLPAKIILGSILDLSESGNSVVVEWDNCGECRQKTYCLVHQSILRQLGVNVKVLAAQPTNITGWLLEIISGISKHRQRWFIRDVLRDLWRFDMRFMKKKRVLPTASQKLELAGKSTQFLSRLPTSVSFHALKNKGLTYTTDFR